MPAGQAQKEFTVNEALARIAMLLHPVVSGQRTSEPANAVPGECFLVLSPATGDFAGQEERLAGWDGQQWTFIDPTEGMMVRDASSGILLHYVSGWHAGPSLENPQAGTTIDVEARAAIVAIADALRNFGIIS